MTTQDMFKDQTSDFQSNSERQTLDGFSQEALNVASSVLNTVKSAFDMFTNMVQQTVKFRRILEGLVSPFGRPNPVARLLAYVGLPVLANKALVAKDVTVPHPLQHNLRCIA